MKNEGFKEVRSILDDITDGWKTDFRFSLHLRENNWQMWIEYKPNKNEVIWHSLNLGAKEHPIRAKNAKTLAFPWGGPGSYQPKTQPSGRSLQLGGPGTVAGGKMHFPVEVQHPGIEARDFDGYIRMKFAPTFRKIIRDGIKNGLAETRKRGRYIFGTVGNPFGAD